MKNLKIPRPLACLIALLSSAPAHADPMINWTTTNATNTANSNLDTASPTLGDGSVSSADPQSIYASMTSVSLVNIGEKVTLSGSAALVGIDRSPVNVTYANQFRFALFNEGGDPADILGWLGYQAGNGDNTTGANLHERINPNTVGFFATPNGAELLATGSAPNTALTNATYSFTLSLERVATGVQINSSMKRSGDEVDFALASFLDTTPQTYDFNRVAFLMGNDLNADQVQFSNIDVTFTAGGAASLAITSFVSAGSGIWEVAVKGEPGAICEFRSSPSLDFVSGTLVEDLTKGDPGDPGGIGGTNDSRVTLDGSGNALVRMVLPADPKAFVRGQTVP